MVFEANQTPEAERKNSRAVEGAALQDSTLASFCTTAFLFCCL